MTMRRRLISQAEFDRARVRSRMAPATLAIAHAVLVKGERQIDIVRKTKKTRAWISEAVGKFMYCVDEAERLTLPTGWETDTVSLPQELWPQVRSLERTARAELKKTAAKK